MGVFGTHIYYDGEDFYCKLCERWFYSRGALEDHCRNTTRHEWCERCERVFRTEHEKTQHEDTSASHNICSWCDHRPDFPNARALDNHRANCHSMCRICAKFFQNDNNLRMHMRSHQTKDKECFGCCMKFGSYSAMLIHLEAGTCPSDTDFDIIKDLAFECYQHRKYTNDFGDHLPFYCPECHADFRTLSGLFQHAETRPSCSGPLEHPCCLWKLIRFISHQI